MVRILIKIGDVIEISHRAGISYGQVINTNKRYKFVLAVYEGSYNVRPDDLDSIVSQRVQFITLFLVQDAVNQGIFDLIGNTSVPLNLKRFPIFRTTNNPGQGRKTMWWFWDGENEWRVDTPLTWEQKQYPKRSLPSAPVLIDWIENNFRVEKDYL